MLADRGTATDLLTALARRHAADHPQAMNVLYVDGHVRTYHGTRKIQKTHVSRLLTWRKAPAPDVPAAAFTEHTHTDDLGRLRTLTLADTTVRIPMDDSDPAAGTVALRQVSKLDSGTGRQVHILTSRTDLSPAQACFRMSARWRQENYFRYGRIRFALDSLLTTALDDDR